MDDNLHNDNLEDFFRKSLQNLKGEPDDFAWKNIASAIQPAINPEINTLQKSIRRLQNQNLLLKALLVAISMIWMSIYLFSPRQEQAQQKITFLGQQFAVQNQTIEDLNHKIDSLYTTINTFQNQTFFASNDTKKSSLKSPSVTLQQNTSTSAFHNSNNSPVYNHTSQFHSQNSSKNKSQHPSDSPLHFSLATNQTPPLIFSPKIHSPLSLASSKLQYLPYLSIREVFGEDDYLETLKQRGLSEENFAVEKKKQKRIQLPSLKLKPILQKLSTTAFVQVGANENHFRYEDSFIGENFLNINGKFKEDALMYQYGLLVSYHAQKQVEIQSGIAQLSFYQKTKGVQLEGVYTTPNSEGVLDLKDQFYTSYSDNELQYSLENVEQQFPNAFLGDTIRVPVDVEQTISYISIPLAVKYNLTSKRLGVYLKGGININLLSNNDLDVSSPHISFQKHQHLSSKNLENIYWSYQLEAGLQYQLNKHVQLELTPYFTSSLSPLTKNLPVIAYPTTAGLKLGANIRF